MENKLKDHYDLKYKNSDSLLVKSIPKVTCPSDRFEMAMLMASGRNGKYLEIGAGSGNVALSVLQKYDELVLTELSSIRINELARLFKDQAKVKVIQHNIEDEALDYPDCYFDTIVMVAVIEHLIDPRIALKELHRVLKPDGRLIIDTPNIAKWTRRIKLLFGYFPSTASLDEGLFRYDKITPTDLHDDGHLHYFTFRSLSRMCMLAGFSKVEWLGYGNWSSTKTPYYLARYFPTILSEIFVMVSK